MRSKLEFLDPIIVIGVIISVALAVILVLIGQDGATSLLIGLVLTTITLLIDVISRVKETESNIIQASTLETMLTRNPFLLSAVSQIAKDYGVVKKSGFDFFTETAENSLLECRDMLHSLGEGRMIEDIDRTKLTYGSRMISDAQKSVKVVTYANLSFWRTKYGQHILKENIEAVKRGVDFTRIWLQDYNTLVEYQDILKIQRESGLRVLVAFPEDLPSTLLEDYRIMDDKVLVKLELMAEGHAKSQHISIDPTEVNRAAKKFELLLKYAYSFDDDFFKDKEKIQKFVAD
ncbi:MAG: hypothetical protein GY797_01880 [Deltaproteobacteria bacterium]|nr:hypothetical protein [Deltaproteobacteria bacterium]